MAPIAHRTVQVVDHCFMACFDLRRLLDRQATARTAQSQHALVDDDAHHPRHFRDQLPDGQIPEVGALGVLRQEMTTITHLDHRNLAR